MKSIIFLAFLLPITLLAQIGAKTQQSKITGLWQNSQFGYQMTLMLNPDGRGEFDGESITYSTNTNKLLITQSGETTTYTFVLQGNSLTLSGGDLDQSVTFTKTGTTENQVAQAQQPGVKIDSKSSLLGVWSGNGESIEFKDNHQCVYMGNTFSFEESQGHIILTTHQGKVMFAYAIQGDQLNLTANGQKVTYTRGVANQAAQPNFLQNKNGGNVAQELVGKWCWTNVTTTNSGGSTSSRCIVLNANGTYEYASEQSMDTNTNAFYAGTSSQGSDRGTWYVQGDRIFYNSQTNGQGSYQLQKINHPKNHDPMIVLDGEAYVTFYQKPAW
ncbi:MAG: hypothetical protein JNM78_01155 [Cyclobacteriaceae bacterium]|nr:hypothetical protein [Cyclobacteriaceae bacterium]